MPGVSRHDRVTAPGRRLLMRSDGTVGWGSHLIAFRCVSRDTFGWAVAGVSGVIAVV
jgi:hypothetical protein